MDIQRSGSQPSAKGADEYFIDSTDCPLFEAHERSNPFDQETWFGLSRMRSIGAVLHLPQP